MHSSQHVKNKLNQWNTLNLVRKRNAITHRESANNIVHIKDHPCINFCSNDYLGLIQHPKLVTAFVQGAKQYGFGSGSSSLVSGYFDSQREIEARFAAWLQVDNAILFNSGYLANIGVIGALANRNTTIFSDKLCHTSLLDGIQLSRAKHYRYRHCDSTHLRQLASTHKPDLIITESLFSMEGNIAPIKEIVTLAHQQQSGLIIDDAHGIGVLGKKGGGICEHAQLNQSAFSCLIAPLGKAFNGMGAIVAGNDETMQAVLQFSKSYCYSTALPPAISVGLQAALDIVIEEQWRRDQLNSIIQFFIRHAHERELTLTSSELTPIKCILIGGNTEVMKLQNKLLSKGFYISAIRPPTVPPKTARLRISLNCLHTEQQIIQLLDAIFEGLT